MYSEYSVYSVCIGGKSVYSVCIGGESVYSVYRGYRGEECV